MSHQKEAIEKLVRNKKFILADDMGLGKTTSTIISALETGAKKILIICPASLKINWEREIANYSDRTVYIAEGKKFSDESDFVIINYDILKNIMKKVVRLTESDLTRIVKRVIKEDSSLRNIVKDKISSSMTTSGKFIESEEEIKNDILSYLDELLDQDIELIHQLIQLKTGEISGNDVDLIKLMEIGQKLNQKLMSIVGKYNKK